MPEASLITVILTILAILGVLVNAYVKRDTGAPKDQLAAVAHEGVDQGKVAELIQSQEDRCVARYIRELDALRSGWSEDRKRWEQMLADGLKTMNQVFANTSERMTTCENTMKVLSRDVLSLRDKLNDHIEHHA